MDISSLRHLTSRLNFKDITWYNIKNYIQGTYRYWLYKNDIAFLPKHIIEQVEDRKLLCDFCWDNQEALCCGCKTPEVYFSDKSCLLGKFPKMMNKDDWNKSELLHTIDR